MRHAPNCVAAWRVKTGGRCVVEMGAHGLGYYGPCSLFEAALACHIAKHALSTPGALQATLIPWCYSGAHALCALNSTSAACPHLVHAAPALAMAHEAELKHSEYDVRIVLIVGECRQLVQLSARWAPLHACMWRMGAHVVKQ